MKLNSALFVVISLVFMVLVNSCAKYGEQPESKPAEPAPVATTKPEPTQVAQPTPPARLPSLIVSQQNLTGNQILIEGLYLDKPGFVVVHKSVDNKPGAVIGHSELVSGEKNNFGVMINASEAGTSVFAMLHYDDNNNGVYEFPAEDKPIVIENNVLVKPVTVIQSMPKKETVTAPQSTEPKKEIGSYPDAFDGISINTEKYSIKIAGNGSLKQDNRIVMTGDAKDEIIWNILYTNKEIDFTKDFTVEVDLNLTSDVQRGDAMAIIAIEPKDKVLLGQMPEHDYCEVSASPSHGTIIRSERTGHGSQIPETAGKFKLSYNALKEKFSCSLNDKEIDEDQKWQFGKFVLTLRAGLHDISGAGIEYPTTGSFTVRYDNLNLIQSSDKK